MAVRVRFAPSPTGAMHLGGLRTALFNYIFSKQKKGTFILRIEDTDQARSILGSAQDIESTLNWAGLHPDESPIVGGKYGPYVQSERAEYYRSMATNLLEKGAAYRCFCSKMRLELLRREQAKNHESHMGYDGKCRNLSKTEIMEKMKETDGQYVLRFKLHQKSQHFNDLVHGRMSLETLGNLRDPIIMKRDGLPTYHFANVTDDKVMHISHVIRGSEWLHSTGIHLQIYDAFEWKAPQFAHLPLITNMDGKKLSKRENVINVSKWRQQGFRAIVLLNFLANLNGVLPKSKADSDEIWSLEKLIHVVNMNNFSTHGCKFKPERLVQLNKSDLRKSWRSDPSEFLDRCIEYLQSRNVRVDHDKVFLSKVLQQYIERISTLEELTSDDLLYLWSEPVLTWSRDEFNSISCDLGHCLEDLAHLTRSVK